MLRASRVLTPLACATVSAKSLLLAGTCEFSGPVLRAPGKIHIWAKLERLRVPDCQMCIFRASCGVVKHSQLVGLCRGLIPEA